MPLSRAVRSVFLETEVEETVKWRAPCYVRNVAGISAFREYFGLWFFLGARIDDDAGVLVNAQEDSTVDLHQWRLTTAGDTPAHRPSIRQR